MKFFKIILNWTLLKIFIVLFGFQLIGLVFLIPPFIPEFSYFVLVMVGLASMSMGILFLVGLIQIYKNKTRLLFWTFLILGILYFSFWTLIVGFFSHFGVFSQVYFRTIDLSQFGTKMYLYDASFFRHATSIKIKHRYLPIVEDVIFVNRWSVQYVEDKIVNGTIIFEQNQKKIIYDISNRKIIQE